MNSYPIAFCINCDEKNSYNIKSEVVKKEVRGTEFSYIEQKAFCANCGEEVYVPEVNDNNVQAAEDAYRKASGLITVAEVNKILEKYKIGAGPLAKLIGFGEITINRYVKGQLLSKEHSDRLLEVLASYKKMDWYLEKGKDSLTGVAYAKCRSEVDRLKELYSNNKIEVIARFIITNSGDITHLALQKLLYYAQGFYEAIFGTELFTDRCQAWTYGPVYPDVYYKYSKFGNALIDEPSLESETDLDELTTGEIDFLNSIISAFGCYSGSVLRNMTHSEQPWLAARGSLLPQDRSVTEIDEKVMSDYFSEVVENYKIVNPCDMKAYSSAMFRKVTQ